MKTYSETKGNEPFDWRAFLNQEAISEADADDAKRRAQSWVTCACGNQCVIIPRDSLGSPVDEILRKVGGDDGFYGAIKRQNWNQAKHFLDLIEIHSAYLIHKEKDNIEQNLVSAIERARILNIDIEELLK